MQTKRFKSKTSLSFILIFSFLIISCNGLKKTNTSAKDISIKSNQLVNQDFSVPFVNPTANKQISRFVRKIFQDKSGNLWFGTNGDGVIRYDGEILEYFSIREGLGGGAVRGIVEDKEGNVWFGTDGGLTKYDGDSFINYTEKNGLVNNDVWSLAIDNKGMIWIGTLEGTCLFDKGLFTPFVIPDTEPDPLKGISRAKMVNFIMQDSKDNMWFGTSGGAYFYDGKSLTNISKKDGLCDNSVNSILEDNDGNIWFATHHKGISRFDGESFKNYTVEGIIDGNEVWTIYKDGNGDLWFPAENYGVYLYDGNSFTNFYKKDGLTTNAIQCFYRDREGRFWLGGWMGLFRYDNNSFVSVTNNGPWEK